ncbi:MAG TPA: DUF998 domain-containing protein [Chloroflexia bacterium]|nr:DUF998 domain-containing protein [Chloroflexia bacterium]
MSKVITQDNAAIAANQSDAQSAANLRSAAPAAISPAAARISLGATALFLVLLTLLHFITPELDPSWRMISEYGIGTNGWVMTLAFISLAAGCVALFAAIRSQVLTLGGRIGLAFLLISAAGMTIAGIFTTDPITATPAELTTSGSLHGFGAMLGIPGVPLAAAFISWSLSRSQAWASVRRSVLWAAALTWVGVLGFSLAMPLMLQGQAGFGPDVPIGWPNRLLIVTDCVWLLVVAGQAVRLRGREA